MSAPTRLEVGVVTAGGIGALYLLGRSAVSFAVDLAGGRVTFNEVFGLALVVLVLALGGLALADVLRPHTLDDKPARFLDERQVHAARQEAAEHAEIAYFRALRGEVARDG